MEDSLLGQKPVCDRFRLDGRVALVTGGGSGIGRAYCHALAEAGAKVAVVDLSREAAERVADEIAKKRLASIAIAADVTNPDQRRAMVQTIVNHWGSLTIGINNAGICMWKAAEDLSVEDWNKVIRLNLDAVFFCAQEEARQMMGSGYGKIINTASMSAHIVNMPQKQVSYNTSKAGIIHMTRSLAAEWVDKGIRVNCISPGYMRTPLVADLIATPEGSAMLSKWLSMTPMNRLGEVPDLQGAVVYLASEASDFMTGGEMVIDGGYCLW